MWNLPQGWWVNPSLRTGSSSQGLVVKHSACGWCQVNRAVSSFHILRTTVPLQQQRAHFKNAISIQKHRPDPKLTHHKLFLEVNFKVPLALSKIFAMRIPDEQWKNY